MNFNKHASLTKFVKSYIMKFKSVSYQLKFKHPFGVSSNVRLHTLSVFIQLQLDEYVGYGEACLPAYLGETEKETLDFFETIQPVLKSLDKHFDLQTILSAIHAGSFKHNAAKAAVDIALHDIYGKIRKQSVAQIYGFESKTDMPTSFTIGIDAEEKLIQKIEEAKEFSVLKIKAGTKDDKKLIATIRKYTDKPLYVDVNQGWKDKNYVLEMIHWMKEQNVVLVEQPMPLAHKEDMRWVTERSPLLTIADESVKGFEDLIQMNGAFGGINMKLMKSGGISEAINMIQYCKQRGIKIMLGCMAESSCATSAMAQLLPFADFVDLDAPQLYTNDPFSGVRYKNGKILIPMVNGVGAEPITNLFH